MRVPKKLRFLGRTYAVKHDDAYTEEHNAYGLVNFGMGTIFLKPRKSGVSEVEEADTLMHESFHIINHHYQLNLTEDQIHFLTLGFLAMIRDNKLDFLGDE